MKNLLCLILTPRNTSNKAWYDQIFAKPQASMADKARHIVSRHKNKIGRGDLQAEANFISDILKLFGPNAHANHITPAINHLSVVLSNLISPAYACFISAVLRTIYSINNSSRSSHDIDENKRLLLPAIQTKPAELAVSNNYATQANMSDCTSAYQKNILDKASELTLYQNGPKRKVTNKDLRIPNIQSLDDVIDAMPYKTLALRLAHGWDNLTEQERTNIYKEIANMRANDIDSYVFYLASLIDASDKIGYYNYNGLGAMPRDIFLKFFEGMTVSEFEALLQDYGETGRRIFNFVTVALPPILVSPKYQVSCNGNRTVSYPELLSRYENQGKISKDSIDLVDAMLLTGFIDSLVGYGGNINDAIQNSYSPGNTNYQRDLLNKQILQRLREIYSEDELQSLFSVYAIHRTMANTFDSVNAIIPVWRLTAWVNGEDLWPKNSSVNPVQNHDDQIINWADNISYIKTKYSLEYSKMLVPWLLDTCRQRLHSEAKRRNVNVKWTLGLCDSEDVALHELCKKCNSLKKAAVNLITKNAGAGVAVYLPADSPITPLLIKERKYAASIMPSFFPDKRSKLLFRYLRGEMGDEDTDGLKQAQEMVQDIREYFGDGFLSSLQSDAQKYVNLPEKFIRGDFLWKESVLENFSTSPQLGDNIRSRIFDFWYAKEQEQVNEREVLDKNPQTKEFIDFLHEHTPKHSSFFLISITPDHVLFEDNNRLREILYNSRKYADFVELARVSNVNSIMNPNDAKKYETIKRTPVVQTVQKIAERLKDYYQDEPIPDVILEALAGNLVLNYVVNKEPVPAGVFDDDEDIWEDVLDIIESMSDDEVLTVIALHDAIKYNNSFGKEFGDELKHEIADKLKSYNERVRHPILNHITKYINRNKLGFFDGLILSDKWDENSLVNRVLYVSDSEYQIFQAQEKLAQLIAVMVMRDVQAIGYQDKVNLYMMELLTDIRQAKERMTTEEFTEFIGKKHPWLPMAIRLYESGYARYAAYFSNKNKSPDLFIPTLVEAVVPAIFGDEQKVQKIERLTESVIMGREIAVEDDGSHVRQLDFIFANAATLSGFVSSAYNYSVRAYNTASHAGEWAEQLRAFRKTFDYSQGQGNDREYFQLLFGEIFQESMKDDVEPHETQSASSVSYTGYTGATTGRKPASEKDRRVRTVNERLASMITDSSKVQNGFFEVRAGLSSMVYELHNTGELPQVADELFNDLFVVSAVIRPNPEIVQANKETLQIIFQANPFLASQSILFDAHTKTPNYFTLGALAKTVPVTDISTSFLMNMFETPNNLIKTAKQTILSQTQPEMP